MKKYSGFSRIGSILPDAAKDKKLQESMRKYRIMRLWHEGASAFVPEAKNATQAIDYSKGVLTIACLSEIVAKDIIVMQDRIIYAINQLLGEETVEKIKIEI